MTALRKELLELTEILPEEKILVQEKKSALGILSKYANKDLIEQEKFAWEKSASEKYAKNFD